MAVQPATVDEYIASFPPEVREILTNVRAAIRTQMPNADEKMRYGIAAFMLGGRYGVHFGGWKKHVGLYPIPLMDAPIEAELAPYRTTKDTVRFLYSKPIPYDLIERVTAAIVAERAAQSAGRGRRG